MSKSRKILLALVCCVFMLNSCVIGFCQDLSMLSFDSKEMIAFDHWFKRYIAALKVKPDKEKAVAAINYAIDSFSVVVSNFDKSPDELKGRLEAIRSMLFLARARIMQGKLECAKELSVPLRTELYLLHEENNLLTPEDYMIRFHNGILHRAEPLIEQERYMELEMLIPTMEKTLEKFKPAPAGVTNREGYQKKFIELKLAVGNFVKMIKKANTYVDPEYGAFEIKSGLVEAFNKVHKRFGMLYLSFPGNIGYGSS